ncbi:MAG TPA: cytochrome P450, partial [Streptosporangiaceae bacterium]|nr:cytochrome P450 [Streptosporangiaceae bacterium]
MPDDAVAMLAMSLLWAGHETTVYTIGIGALLLLTQPQQWQALHADPALVPAAAEEAPRAAGWGGTPL